MESAHSLNEADLRYETFRNASPTIWMRIVHIPTALVVTGEDTSQIRLRSRLLCQLGLELAKTLLDAPNPNLEGQTSIMNQPTTPPPAFPDDNPGSATSLHLNPNTPIPPAPVSSRPQLPSQGHFTMIGMRTSVLDPDALVINTCAGNDTDLKGDETTWIFANPTNRAIKHVLAADPSIVAASVECLWQGTKIYDPTGIPNKTILVGNWRGGKGRKPIGAWNGPGQPFITDPGEARDAIYIPAYRALIEHFLADPDVAAWVEAARQHKAGPVYLRDFDTGKGVSTAKNPGAMSHAWLLAEFLNNGTWPSSATH